MVQGGDGVRFREAEKASQMAEGIVGGGNSEAYLDVKQAFVQDIDGAAVAFDGRSRYLRQGEPVSPPQQEKQNGDPRETVDIRTAAIAQLDRSLGALPGLSPSALQEAGSAAAIVRAMILRADLAAKTGDLETARKWATSVAILWSNADGGLQPEVASMRHLAGNTK